MRVSVLGTGTMGAAMARSLAREGHEVTVWNRSPDKAEAVAEGSDAITTAGSVAEAVGSAEVVMTMLFDGDAVLSVADELVAALPDGAVWVQSSTVGPDSARTIAATAPGRVLDAPVLGTKQPAEEGTLVVLASGPRGLLDTAQPALDAVGSRTVVAGDEIGQGSALKLACNAWVGLITAGTAQSLGLARALGVDPALFLAAVEGGAADSPYVHAKGEPMLADGEGDVAFALDGVRKDLDLMVAAARGAGFRDDLLLAVKGLYDDASAAGHGSDDIGAVHHAFDPS